MCGGRARYFALEVIQKFTTIEGQSVATTKTQTDPFPQRHNASLPCFFCNSYVCDCEAYTGKFITLKPVDQFLRGKVVSFKNENLYTGRLVSNVVTFVSFDMETLFYDEVQKLE